MTMSFQKCCAERNAVSGSELMRRLSPRFNTDEVGLPHRVASRRGSDRGAALAPSDDRGNESGDARMFLVSSGRWCWSDALVARNHGRRSDEQVLHAGIL